MQQRRRSGSANKKSRRPSLSDSSDDNGPESPPTIGGFFASATPSNRLERKRNQEKRRRQEFKEALDNLQATLLKHDEDFLTKSQQGERRSSSPGVMIAQLKEGNTLINRVALVNQAISTIRGFRYQNDLLKTVIADLKAGRTPVHNTSNVSLPGLATADGQPLTSHWEGGPFGSINEGNHRDYRSRTRGELTDLGKREEDETDSGESHVVYPSTLVDHRSPVTSQLPYYPGQTEILAQMQRRLSQQVTAPMLATGQLFQVGSVASHLPLPVLDGLHWGFPRHSPRPIHDNLLEQRAASWGQSTLQQSTQASRPIHDLLLEQQPAASWGQSTLQQSTHASLAAQRSDVGSSSVRDTTCKEAKK
jgi:hypothetical protein